MKSLTPLVPRLISFTFLALSIWTATAAGATEKVLYNFSTYPHGARPYSNLIADAGGNLYGTTYTGGAHGLGAVFKLAPSAKGPWTQTVLYSFKGGSDGQYPISRLVFDTAGNLYGTTGSGGTSTCNGNKGGCGTVFKLAPNSHSGWTESVIYKFKGGSDGDDPWAGLTLDSTGNLYGTTVLGGTGQSTFNCLYGCGTVFRLAPGSHGTWTESILYNFTGSDGINPQGELIFDSAGSLYGTTRYGGSSGSGAVYKLTPASNSWTQSVLYSFTGRTDGADPLSSLIFDKAGNLYGTAALGGSCAGGCGVVFELVSNGNGSFTENVIHTFVGGAGDGDAPTAGLVFDQAGNLYGTTGGGGKSNGPVGVVFELSPSSGGQWTETIVHVFAGSIDGAHPSSGGALVIDKANNLYGTTIEGGIANTNTTLQAGTAFELTPGASGQWTKSTIYSFPSTDGMNPNGKLIQDASGNFYGSTFYGGTYGLGQVFKLAPNSSGGWTRTVIYNFKATTDGYGPNALVFDNAGNLYGTAGSNVGATTGNGEIFELKPNGSTWTESTIYTFSTNTADGQAPVGLVIDASGNLYGETQLGGTSLFGGTVYKLTNNGSGVWTKSILYNFSGFNGPEGGLVIDAAGNLYGTTYGGGTNGWGVVFELSNSGGIWTEKVLYEFLGGSDGAAPFGGVIFDPAGNLYGTTAEGGSAKLGTVFKLTPSAGSWTESVLHSFTGGSDGAGVFPTMPGLVIDAAGNLYGTTPKGGDITCNCGIVFELSPGSGGQWTETVLHNFTSFPGDGTGGLPLIVDASGVLYGTSAVGGSANDGAIFEVTP
jgi:uncharacterized repeat protein (TIGR03803 family)